MFVLKLSGIQYIFLTQIYFHISEIFNTTFKTVLSTKSPFEYVLMCFGGGGAYPLKIGNYH